MRVEFGSKLVPLSLPATSACSRPAPPADRLHPLKAAARVLNRLERVGETLLADLAQAAWPPTDYATSVNNRAASCKVAGQSRCSEQLRGKNNLAFTRPCAGSCQVVRRISRIRHSRPLT